ncbi:immunoglobulin-like domain-containing protein [Clostridium neuense]|uniref:Immunoglobulin-like domain-containing protein n=1 Tax=Clostridium neuense TaxID=1728934 RepID=A0ABW8TPF4_9CLOT
MNKKGFTFAFLVFAFMLVGFCSRRVYAADANSSIDILEKAKDQIEFKNLDNLEENLNLPSMLTVDGKNVYVSWKSDKENVISSSSGYVNRQNINELVTLTATLKCDSYEDTKTFKAIVPAEESKANLLDLKVVDVNTIKLTFDDVPSQDKEDYVVRFYGLDEDKIIPVNAVKVDGFTATLSVDLSKLAGELVVNDLPVSDLINFKDVAPSSSGIKLTLVSSSNLELGKIADITVHAQNNARSAEEVPICIALFNADNNSIVKYTYLSKTVGAGDSCKFSGKIKIPETGNYYLKYFMIDNLDNMKQLEPSDAITIEKIVHIKN